MKLVVTPIISSTPIPLCCRPSFAQRAWAAYHDRCSTMDYGMSSRNELEPLTIRFHRGTAGYGRINVICRKSFAEMCSIDKFLMNDRWRLIRLRLRRISYFEWYFKRAYNFRPKWIWLVEAETFCKDMRSNLELFVRKQGVPFSVDRSESCPKCKK